MELHLQITTPVNLEMHESQRWSIRQRSVSSLNEEFIIHCLVVVVVVVVFVSMRNYSLGGKDS